MMIPALCVKQPWASMLARGEKTIETRTWITGYRGPVAICSSAMPKGQGVTRRALCVAFLKHCRAMTVEDEAAAGCPIYPKATAWVFGDILIPLAGQWPVRGQLGLFPLMVPEGEFFAPEDRQLAYRWLDWAKNNWFLEHINQTRKRSDL